MKNNFDEYVDFLIYNKKTFEYYLLWGNNSIRLITNSQDIVYKIYSSKSIVNELKGKLIGEVIVLIDKNILEKRYDYNDYNDSSFTLKTHKMYIEGVSNSRYDFKDFYEFLLKIKFIFTLNCEISKFHGVILKSTFCCKLM